MTGGNGARVGKFAKVTKFYGRGRLANRPTPTVSSPAETLQWTPAKTRCLNFSFTRLPDRNDLLNINVAGDSLFLDTEDISLDSCDPTANGRALAGHIDFLTHLGLQKILHSLLNSLIELLSLVPLAEARAIVDCNALYDNPKMNSCPTGYVPQPGQRWLPAISTS